ncbi:EF-hand domain-containing protein [Rhizobium sp. TRM96647]|uniref:EF-hand domain-containing protein n=1 Tax=unclassified Rhizobium TaxID=2613769 RepID=UPI001E5621EC|nr:MULTISPECIES: EF-hand domain-containing protein [unclassified Rhizobium]MCD2183547.1 EF-hand domain-containing protein [Rhizobium sp. GN54]MCV3739433.1 EF-hand domain-containing protein [Rhizobium sp. TRM96647]MCV3761105.1 EF-hand domain-containing protein [Rhizobium sp. TRM96650]
MKKAFLVAALVACQCTLSFAQAQTAAIHQGHKDQLDTNKDGTVQRSEYQAFMATAFTNLDKNKNGSLSKSEVGTVLTADQFSATDGDNNGSISQAEFMNRVMADFAAADRSGDGALQ